MPFYFNAVELCVVTINEKLWACSKEVCRALEYNRKTPDIVRPFCSLEYYAQKYQMSGFTAQGKPVDWPKDQHKYDIYTNEGGIYKLLFSSQQPKEKDFRRLCWNVLSSHIRQQLSDKSHAMQIKDLTSRAQTLEFTNEEGSQTQQQQILRLNEDYRQAIEEKMQQLRCLMMTYKIASMKTWHYKHKRLCIKPSYKNVKISSLILKYVMFLMREIPAKTTLSSLYGNTQRLPMISFMIYHIILRGYNDIKGMLS